MKSITVNVTDMKNYLFVSLKASLLNFSCLVVLIAVVSFGDAFGQTTVTFSATGANQTWICPQGVTSVDVRIWGAGGGGSAGGPSSGGSGAFVRGTMAVTPGQSYVIVVGRGGTYSTAGSSAGGFGGGGIGYIYGGSGGGYSGIFTTSVSQANALAVAGGGGGGGYHSTATNGGAGGATTGTNGGDVNATTFQGGRGGTIAAGGARGTGTTLGTNGSALQGGDGGNNSYGGGGGGGGYFGGGGGYGSASLTRYSSGGGGGSSFLGTLTATTNTVGTTNTTAAANQAPGSGQAGYVAGSGNGGSSVATAGGNGLVTITIPCTAPVAPTTIAGTNSICSGSSTTLTASGGTTGTEGLYLWYSGACPVNAFSQHWIGNTNPYTPFQTTVNSVTGGFINLTSTGGDPNLNASGLGPFTAAAARYVNIRYRVISGTAGSAEIFFYNTNNGNSAVGGDMVSGTLISDNTWRVLSIDMSADPQYALGNISGFRFDWATNTGVNMQIDFVSLSSSPIVGEGTALTVSPTSNTTYFSAIQNACGLTTCASQAVTVVTGLPTITAQPTASGAVCVGGTLTTSVTAGNSPTAYIWQRFLASTYNDVTSVMDGTNTYTNFTTVTMGISAINSSMNGRQFRCNVTNACGTTSSNLVTITVNPIATPGTFQYANVSTQTICAGSAISCTNSTSPTNGGAGTLTTVWYCGELNVGGTIGGAYGANYGNWRESTLANVSATTTSSNLNAAAGGGAGTAFDLTNYNPQSDFPGKTNFVIIRRAYNSNCGVCVGGCQDQYFFLNLTPLSAAPTITGPVCPGSTTVSGTGINGSTINVIRSGSSIGTATVSGGVWTATVSTVNAGDALTVTQTEVGLCASPAASYTVISPPTFANLQWPPTATICGTTTMVYGKVYRAGSTPPAGAPSDITAELGWSSSNTNPNTWMDWTPASFNTQVVNDDEFQAPLGAGLTSGTWYYTMRYNYAGCYVYGGYNSGFWNGTSNPSGVANVPSSHTATLSSGVGTNNQTICQNSAITNITYTIGNGGNNASTTGLPAGVTGAFSGGTYTISGSPTASGTFNYSVTTSGPSNCPFIVTGTITVSETLDFVNLQFPSTAAVCFGSSANVFGQVFESGLTNPAGQGAGITLHCGISPLNSNTNPNTWSSWTAATFNAQSGNNDEYIASIGSALAAGTYYYAFRYSYNGCVAYGGYNAGGGGFWDGSANVSGILTINPANTAGVASASPTLCINSALTAVTHTSTSATGISNAGVSGANGLPPGVSASWASNTITISGTPTVANTYNYSIPLTGGCGTVNVTGTIIVTPLNNAGVASSAPSVCNNSPITTITHTTVGASGISNAGVSGANGLPPGVSASWASNTISITGTPTANGTYAYSIPLTGGCGAANATGTITVNQPAVNPITGTTSLCVGQTSTLGGNFTIHYFTTPGTTTFTPPTTAVAQVLVVAGGGGGGFGRGGGGGGGGVIYNSSFNLTAGSPISVTVGDGGIGGTTNVSNSATGNGQNSIFGTITATGGGLGGSHNPGATANCAGLSGGSGGGGAINYSSSSVWAGGTASPSGQGFAGGSSGPAATDNPRSTGGGGGAGGAGVSPGASTATPSNGGVGISNSISGSAVFYGGGGGGANGNAFGETFTTAGAGAGGSGGGGNGAPLAGNPTNGAANTGGGGGGGGQGGSSTSFGGNGGSGIVIVRNPSATWSWTSSNTSVATVNPITGVVTALAGGTTTITFTIFSGGCSNSVSTTVTVGAYPTITLQPTTPATICGAGTATVSVTATSATSYQWFKGGVALTNGSTYSNVTTNTMTITNPALSENGAVLTCVISGGSTCTVTTSSVTLSVNATPANATSVTANPSTICVGETVQLSAISAGNSINWWSASTGGTLITSSIASGANFGVSPISTTTYHAESTTALTIPGSQTFNYTGAITTWTVPAGVSSINVTARGAQGGSNGGLGGQGAIITGTLAVTPGQVLSLLVGQQPTGAGSYAAGGGGSFVALGATVATATPLLVAGGGGGSALGTGGDASITTSGNGPLGGTLGNGGAVASCGGGGGGFFTSGGNDVLVSPTIAIGGSGFRQGGAGGTFAGYQSGGFGGGASANYYGSCNMQAGAGGGYSGGSGQNSGTYLTTGYGGGSFNSGTNQSNTIGNTGNGQIVISYNTIIPLCPATARVPVTVNVNPLPTITAQPASTAQQACLNATPVPLSVSATAGSGTITTYEWYSNTTASNAGGTLVATNASSALTNTYTPVTTTLGTLYYYVIVVNSNGCRLRSAVSGAVIVNPNPTAVTAASSVSTICNGSTINLTSSATSNFAPLQTLLSPSGDGGFETSAAAFSALTPSNGWLMAAVGNNLWYNGTAVVNSGSRAAYISTNASGGVLATYGINAARVSHLYRDVVIPAGATNITLSFNWQAVGEGTDPFYFDFLSVAMVPTTTTPVAATALTSGILATNLNNQSTWQFLSIPISSALAGTTQRLVFTWQNDASLGTAPGAVIDNVSITANVAPTPTFAWSASPAGFTSAAQNPIGVAPTGNTTYTVAVTNGFNCTASNTVAVVVNPRPTSTITSATTANLCYGNDYAITGNITATGAWTMTLSPSGTVTGTGSGTWTSTVVPTALSTAYSVTNIVDALGCPVGTLTGSTTLTLPATTTALSPSDNATCLVKGTNWIHFYSSTGRLIVSINPNGNNLGNVTATSFVDAGPVLTQACGTDVNPNYTSAALARRWVITPTTQPTTNVSVRFPYDNAEFTSLFTAALATANGFDDVSSIADLQMSKYNGTNENGSFADNCGTGTSSNFMQTGNGSVTAGPDFVSTIANAKYVQFSIPGFSEFWLLNTGEPSALPVEITSFAANCNEKSQVDVKWTTASEQNSQNFIVERSRDLSQWEYVTSINAAGNSNYSINYSSVDNDPFGGTSYYRVVQIDLNGAEEIYGPISVSCADESNGMVVFPNPTKGNFTVEITTDEDLSDSQLVITDLSGKVISTKSISIMQGKTQAIFENQELQLGTYIIQLNSSNHNIQPVRVVVN